MGLLGDPSDPDQFQDGGGLLRSFLSALPQLNLSSAGAGVDLQSPLANGSQPQASADASNSPAVSPGPDIGARLGAALQGWAQTPVGSPFAALANGITGFNNAANAPPNGSSSPAPTQSPDLGDRLGAAFQSWAQTPAGSPFAGLANGIAGFNTGQPTPAAAAAPPKAQTPTQAPDPSNLQNAAIQNQVGAPLANIAPIAPIRRVSPRRWPLSYQ